MNYEFIVLLTIFYLLIQTLAVSREPFLQPSIQLSQERDVNTQVALQLLSDLKIRCGFRVNATINSTPITFPLSQRPKGKPAGDVKLSITTDQTKCQINTCSHLSFSFDKYLCQTHLPRIKVNSNFKNTVNIAR